MKENPTSDEAAATLQAMSSVGVANNDMTKKVIEVGQAGEYEGGGCGGVA